MVDSERTADAVAALEGVPLFSSLTKRQITSIAKTAVERNYKPGETIVKQGDKGIGFYLMLDGGADVLKTGQKVGALSKGQFFGEMALLEEQPRTAEVRASSPCRCLVLNRWEFWGAVGNDAAVLRSLLTETVRRLRAPGAGLSE
jgi:CRP-like cAMP-binding protein